MLDVHNLIVCLVIVWWQIRNISYRCIDRVILHKIRCIYTSNRIVMNRKYIVLIKEETLCVHENALLGLHCALTVQIGSHAVCQDSRYS